MLNKIIVLVGCFTFSSMAFAECVRMPDGRVNCAGGGNAATYNPNTGNAAKAQTNQYGVTRTETSRGGQAVTKNGMGAVQTPSGKTCVRTRNNQGCN